MKKSAQMTRLFLIVGVVMIMLGLIFNYFGKNRLARDSVPATATVTDYVEGTAVEYRLLTTVYYPVVSYEIDGNVIAAQYSEHYDEKVYAIGDSVDIKYNPDNPAEFVILDDTVSTQFSGAWAVVLGAVLLVIGLVRTALMKAKTKKENFHD